MAQMEEELKNINKPLKNSDLNEEDIECLHEIIDWWHHRYPKPADPKPKWNNIRFTFHVDLDLLNMLREEARKTGQPQSEILNRILKSSLPDHKG
jgi:hypothetical protein